MIKKALQSIGHTARSLYRDEKGADMVEYVLIFAAISLPIVAILFWYKDKITEWVGEVWEDELGRDDAYEAD